MSHISLPVSGLFSNDVTLLHRFRDISTFRPTVYITASDLETSFSLDTLNIIAVSSFQLPWKRILAM